MLQGGNYRVVFNRISQMSAYSTNTIKLRVDNGAEHQLVNGQSIELRLAPGTHSFELKISMNPRAVRFSANITADRTFTVSTSPIAMGVAWKVITVKDESGKKL